MHTRLLPKNTYGNLVVKAYHPCSRLNAWALKWSRRWTGISLPYGVNTMLDKERWDHFSGCINVDK